MARTSIVSETTSIYGQDSEKKNRTISMTDGAWERLGAIGALVERERSWVLAMLTEHAHERLFVGGGSVAPDIGSHLEELGLR